jgi:AAA domain
MDHNNDGGPSDPASEFEDLRKHYGKFFEDENGPSGAKKPNGDASPKTDPKPKKRKNYKEYLAGYKPAKPVIGRFIEAGYAYAFTAKVFHGKTQFATTTTHAVASGRGDLIGAEVKQGRVAYLALENASDTRKRFIAQRYEYGLDADDLENKIVIIDEFVYYNEKGKCSPLIDAYKELMLDTQENGPLSLVFIDSWQASFAGKNFNDHVEMLEAARWCRKLTTLPGNPAVIVLAHPNKSASEDTLVVAGGGSALAELDANLTMWKDDKGIFKFHYHEKLRSGLFDPLYFTIKVIQCPDLLDFEGRQIEAPVLIPLTKGKLDDVSEKREESSYERANLVLASIAKNPRLSLRERCDALRLPQTTLDRVINTLVKDKLVKKILGKVSLTTEGRKATAASAAGAGGQSGDDGFEVPF